MKTLDMTDENGLEMTPKATATMVVSRRLGEAVIRIDDGYEIKDQLKRRGYKFNGITKRWESPALDVSDPADLYRHWAELRANVAVKPDRGGRLYKAEQVWDDEIAPKLD